MSQQINTADLKARVDLGSIVEADLGPPAVRGSGKWRLWRCPFHNDRGPSFGVHLEDQFWKCFGACGESGDVIAYLRKRDPALTFPEACQRLGWSETDMSLPPISNPQSPISNYQPPSPEWQQAAGWMIQRGERALWGEKGRRALAWLRARGLSDATIRRWRLGFNPQAGSLRRWKYIHRGLLIPCWMGGHLWGVHIRLATSGKDKYRQLAGSVTALFGADRARGRRVVALCEGEFDAMLLDQEAGDLVGAVSTTGGAGRRWEPSWSQALALCDRLLIAFDSDKAGQAGAGAMAGLSTRARVLAVPDGKDVTDYHQAGGNVFHWIRAERSAALAGDDARLLAERIDALRARISPGDAADPLAVLAADLHADLAEIISEVLFDDSFNQHAPGTGNDASER